MAGADLNFGLGRGIGSACYAALVLLLGQLTERYAPTLVVPVFAGLFAILALAVWRFRSAPAPRMEGERPQVLTNLQLLRKYPRFVLLLAACALLMACHSSSCNIYDSLRGEGRSRVRSHGCGFGIGGVSGAAGYGTVQPDAAEAVSGMAAASVRRCVSGEDRSFLAGGVYDRHLSGIGAAIFLVRDLPPATVSYVVEHIDQGNQVKGQAPISVASSGVGSAFGSPVLRTDPGPGRSQLACCCLK